MHIQLLSLSSKATRNGLSYCKLILLMEEGGTEEKPKTLNKDKNRKPVNPQ